MKAQDVKKATIFKNAMKVYNTKLKAGYSSDYAQSAAESFVFNETYTKAFSPLLNDAKSRALTDKICKEFIKLHFGVVVIKTKAEKQQSKINRAILDGEFPAELQLYVNKMIVCL